MKMITDRLTIADLNFADDTDFFYPALVLLEEQGSLIVQMKNEGESEAAYVISLVIESLGDAVSALLSHNLDYEFTDEQLRVLARKLDERAKAFDSLSMAIKNGNPDD